MTRETPPPRRRWLLPGLAAPFFGLAFAHLVAPDAALPLIWAGSATVWVFVPVWALLPVSLHRRDRLATFLCSFVVTCHAVWVGPTLVASVETAPARALRMRIVAANLLYVNQTPGALLDELLETDADVLVLLEVSPLWLEPLADPRVERAYPHRDVMVRSDAFGIAIFSRHPIVRSELVDLVGVPMMDATIAFPGTDVRVVGVHTLPPVDGAYAQVWRAQLEQLRDHVRGAEGPLIVAGDFNATLHAGGIRGLRGAGLVDAHDALGRGLATTWPNGLFLAPPLHLDHVFVSEHLVPIEVTEGRGEGSDHRPVILDLAMRES